MAKRNSGTQRPDAGTVTVTAPPPATADAMEQKVLAFAEQLGRMVGTIQRKADGWMDRETLNTQVASVRDRASQLLTQLASAATASRGKVKKKKKKSSSAARRPGPGRSGGTVDAPGKKHRKPSPAGPGASTVRTEATKRRTAKTVAKTNRLRGRG